MPIFLSFGLKAEESTLVISSGVDIPVDGPPPPGLGLGNPGSPTLVGSKVIYTGKCLDGGEISDCSFSHQCTILKGTVPSAPTDAPVIIIEEQSCLLHICDNTVNEVPDCFDLSFNGMPLSGPISIPIEGENLVDLSANFLAPEQVRADWNLVVGTGKFMFAKGGGHVAQEGPLMTGFVLYWPDPMFQDLATQGLTSYSKFEALLDVGVDDKGFLLN